MTRRKLFGGAALSGLALSSVRTAAATSLAPAAGLTRLSLNENPLGPSPLAARIFATATANNAEEGTFVIIRRRSMIRFGLLQTVTAGLLHGPKFGVMLMLGLRPRSRERTVRNGCLRAIELASRHAGARSRPSRAARTDIRPRPYPARRR